MRTGRHGTRLAAVGLALGLATTSVAAELTTSADGPAPQFLTRMGSLVFFALHDEQAGGWQVWRTDTTKTADETSAAAKTAITTTLSVEGHPFGIDGFGAVRYARWRGTGAGRFSTELTVTNDGTVNESASSATWEETVYAMGVVVSLPHKMWRPRCSEILVQLRSTGLLQSTTYRLPPTWQGLTFEGERLPGQRRVAPDRWF